MSKTVYLAGPITGETFEGCTDWREFARKSLAPGICGLSPLRAKDYLAGENKIGDSYEGLALSSARGIMTRDYFDVQNCDIVIANVKGASSVSIGTVMEIAWAKAFDKPLILVIEPSEFEATGNLRSRGNIHEHAMIREATGFRVETLEEAVLVANAILADYERE